MLGKTKITFVLHKELQQALKERVIKDGYGMRGKSVWINEAINNLMEIKSYPELVKISDDMQGFEASETVVIDHVIKLKLEEAIIAIRKEFPTLEGVKSRIVRTAIMQRLIGLDIQQTPVTGV